MTTTARTKRPGPVRAVIYCRMSLAKHGDKTGVKRQERLCRKVAKRKGWEVVRVFCDNNKSAWRRNRRRPDWDEMLRWIDEGLVDAVVIYHGDRLIRQPWDLEMLLSLADGKGLLLASPTGERNLDNADDRYHLRLDVAKACNESDTIRRRTREVHLERARSGKPRKGGFRTFGYKKSGKKVHEEEAAAYRDAVARVVAGESRSSVLKDWHDRGILTTRGNQWKYANFAYMLRNPRYAGISTYLGEEVGKGRWPALIDREVWEAMQVVSRVGSALYTHGDAGSHRPSTSKYLLSGIATHGICGAVVRSHTESRPEQQAYVCSDRHCTPKVRRNMRHLDLYVVGNVLRRLSDPVLWEEIEACAADDGSAARLVALREKRAATEEQFLDSETMTPAALEKVLRGLDTRIATLEAEVAARQRVHVLDGCRDMSREEWDGLPMDRRRSIVRAAVTVELWPARRGGGFDTASIKVLPREGEVGGPVAGVALGGSLTAG